MDILETDFDFITRLVEKVGTYPDLDSAIHAANQGIAMIARDLAILNGPDYCKASLISGSKAFEEHHERYEEYHKIFKDLTTIEKL